MSDLRPNDPTDWEEEHHQEAVDAVSSSEASSDHTHKVMQELVDASRDIAANSEAVQKITRDSIESDNKKFRRRNALLVFLVSVLIITMGYTIYRDIWVNSPEREKIAQQTRGLQDANAKLDHIEDFIEDVQNNDGDSVSRQELQVVFEAVFDTKAMVECVITASDDAAVAACADASP